MSVEALEVLRVGWSRNSGGKSISNPRLTSTARGYHSKWLYWGPSVSSGSSTWVHGSPGFSTWPAVPVPEWSTNDQAKGLWWKRRQYWHGEGGGGGGGGGINSSRYSGHSFQIEAATTAAQVGMGDATIKAMGRWSLSRLCPEHLAGIPWRLVDRNAD